jgi:hypothetical protein
MKFFQEVMRDLIKQDAFAMEFSALEEPWYPQPDIVIDAFNSFADTILGLWDSDDIFIACANFVDANDPVLLCIRKSGSDVTRQETSSESLDASYFLEWLHKKLGSVTKWHTNKQNRDLIIAPYVVQKSHVIDSLVERRRTYVKDVELDDFLYTSPYLLSQPVPRSFSRAYYAAALVLGVEISEPRYDLKNLYDLAETLSIKFQMSWGYPQLIIEKEEMARNEMLRMQQEKVLERFKRANAITQKLALDLNPAFRRLDQLNRLLRPVPAALLDLYRRPVPYIPDKDHTRYFDRWDFMHDWRPSEILESPESFKAQLACVLLAYAAADIPPPVDGQLWNGHEPWSMLKGNMAEIANLISLVPTLQKTLAKFQEESAAWDAEDGKVFRSLKGCFHYPFKDKEDDQRQLPERLTGPLLTLWAIEYGGSDAVDSVARSAFFSDRSSQGRGWPELIILQEIYSILDDIYEDPEVFHQREMKFGVKVRPKIDDHSRLTGVAIDLPVPSTEQFGRLRVQLSNFRPLAGIGNSRGEFTSYVDSIFKLKGKVTVSSTADPCLEITFPIETT